MAVGKFNLPITVTTDWQRPTDWLAMPNVLTSEQKFVGLYAIHPTGANFAAVLATTSSGDYRVDWGDGTITTHASNTQAQYEYNFASISNSTLTSKGYKQVLITITPVTANLTTLNLNRRHTTATTAYAAAWLDCVCSLPNASGTSAFLVGGSNVISVWLQRCRYINSGNGTGYGSLFINCTALQSVEMPATNNSVTSCVSMFQACSSLKTAPFFPTNAVTSMSQMFSGCVALKNVPLYNTSSVTSMATMFSGCSVIETVPLFNTAACTSMSNMFQNCLLLEEVPSFNTASVTGWISTYSGCSKLEKVGAIDMRASTNNASAFASCSSLTQCLAIIDLTVSFANNQLSRDRIVEIFNNLATVTGQTITVTGNYGTASLTAGDLLIATSKGWGVAT